MAFDINEGVNESTAPARRVVVPLFRYYAAAFGALGDTITTGWIDVEEYDSILVNCYVIIGPWGPLTGRYYIGPTNTTNTIIDVREQPPTELELGLPYRTVASVVTQDSSLSIGPDVGQSQFAPVKFMRWSVTTFAGGSGELAIFGVKWTIED